MKKIVAALVLMRLDKPIGIYLLMWPAILALVISTQGNLSIKSLLVVVIGSIVVRSAGCVINDIWDSNIDNNVTRTKNRPIPAKELTIKEGWLIFIVLSLISLMLLSFTNSNTALISIFFALMIVIYPLTKRFFIGPQLFLGLTFNPVIIVFAMTDQLNNPTMLLLYFAIASLTIAYDSYYGLCDVVDDERLGIQSTPLWWGRHTLKVIALFQLIAMILFSVIGFIDKLNWEWFIGLFGLIFFFIFQNNLAKKEEYLEAFQNNHWAILFISVVAVYCYMV